MKKTKAAVEKIVLKTFQEEIPSVYYSDKSRSEYKKFADNAEYIYRDLFNFPKEMFANKKMLDFGGGTGEQTVYLTNWGAQITHVEMNSMAIDIAKKVFKKYGSNYNKHKFIQSSIFDYKGKTKFDIVHSRGVFSHTFNKELAFDKLASNLKVGGYLIFGDPNKIGGFQNMLQRHIVYSLGRDNDEREEICERLFADDITRSVKSKVVRTRRTIIFDRWIIPQQDDPSVEEVLSWFDKNNIRFYSSHPKFIFPYASNSTHSHNKFDISNFKKYSILSEALWMIKNTEDDDDYAEYLKSINKIYLKQKKLSNYISSVSPDTKINLKSSISMVSDYKKSLKELDLGKMVVSKLDLFLKEVNGLLVILKSKDLNKVDKYLKKTKILFKGYVGVRHIDYVGYKYK